MSDESLDEAIEVMTEHSDLPSLDPNYVALFKSLWRQFDPEQTGMITLDETKELIQALADGGWPDWNISDAKYSNLKRLNIIKGGIPLSEFALFAEDPEYEYSAKTKAEAARMMRHDHMERTKNFTLPSEDDIVAKSERAEDHCVECERKRMMQSTYQTCSQCGGHESLACMAFCLKCAVKMGRCCACGKVVK